MRCPPLITYRVPIVVCCLLVLFFFFLNDPAPPKTYPLPLPAALPIYDAERRREIHEPVQPIPEPSAQPPDHRCRRRCRERRHREPRAEADGDEWPLVDVGPHRREDRKSTRLNSSHLVISYAVFCLKKK